MDHACVQKAACDPYIPLVTSIPAECDESKAIDWINRQNQKIADGTDLPLCIAVGSTNEAVGMIGVFALNLVAEGSARCGYWISPDRRGKNISGRALAILSSWAFDAFAVQTLELLIESDNIGSIRAAESAGYSVGKTLISHKEIGGTLRDMLIYIRTRNSPGSTDAAK
jgi:RimJ/RimL family protein N-acetyltransferase